MLAAAGCRSGPAVDTVSGLPLSQPGERHCRLGGVWVAAHVGPAGESDVTVIYQDGTRLPADAPQVSWASRYSDGLGWKGLPGFKADDYPAVLFGRDDVFVTARRAADGKPATAAP